MGYSSWSDAAYRGVAASRSTAAPAEIFRGTPTVDPLMDPRHARVREARDSEHHPESVPILVAFDVTGSMGDIPTRFAQDMLGKLMTRLVTEAWVKDPQVCFAAVGDAVSDRAPLQVGQFESGLEMDQWLTRIWLEGGGGDAPESYLLPHWFAAHHTATDAWERRRRKGYLFSIGDAPNKALKPAHVHRVFGYAPPADIDDASVIAAAAERYHLFHLLVTRGQPVDDGLLRRWRELLGAGVIVLDHTEAVCELIGVVIGVTEGRIPRARAVELLAAAGMGDAAGVVAGIP
ncbi:MAG TPA: hypothetical protein PKA64_09225 [Myxococcota bacterium]|nr:hypothetical protein [Myxococcota bacterium]